MSKAANHDERIASMTFSSVYPHYVAKVEKKGRTKEELHEVIRWLTGFDERKLKKHIDNPITFEDFFTQATLNPNAHLITGVIDRRLAAGTEVGCQECPCPLGKYFAELR